MKTNSFHFPAVRLAPALAQCLLPMEITCFSPRVRTELWLPRKPHRFLIPGTEISRPAVAHSDVQWENLPESQHLWGDLFPLFGNHVVVSCISNPSSKWMTFFAGKKELVIGVKFPQLLVLILKADQSNIKITAMGDLHQRPHTQKSTE